jgi:formamidopyrimidine-DNA glycosylase
MPELPEVETIARDLRGLVTGSRILDARSDWPATLRSHPSETFRDAIVGREIEGVGRRGKQLLIWLGASDLLAASPAGGVAPVPAPGPSDPAVATIHLKMTGQLFVVAPETPQDKHVHLVFALADGRELRFRDIRKFGRIGLYRRNPATGLPFDGEAEGVLATGVEPFSDEFTAALFFQMLSRRRGRLKTLLLNQDFLAGVGNIYADESLWRARLHPLQDANTVKAGAARRLHQALLDVLAEAVERRGSSVDDYTAPGGDGSMQEHLAVYQRAGEACLRCGRPIERIVVGGRATHFCGKCQRLPVGQRAGTAADGGHAAEPAAAARRGPRWTELDGENALGRTAEEERKVADRAARRAARVAATRKAAASRRAAARSGGPA